jgi:MFS family permease
MAALMQSIRTERTVSKLSRQEIRSASALASVVGLRMFGLFLIMPVLSVYARHMPGSTALLVGLAIGIYGIFQAVLQVPMGMLSDRIGRRVTITLGLLVFVAGSLIAAFAHGIYGVIVGRALQGVGAVSGASQALAADLSNPDNRSKVMAIIGVSVGMAFILAIILSAPLAAAGGLEGLFGTTAALAVGAMILLWVLVPKPQQHRAPAAAGFGDVMRMLAVPRLLVLNTSVFVMHTMLTASFVVLPLVLLHETGMPLTHQWELYLPVMLFSVVVMGGVLRRVHSVSGSMKLILASAVGLGISLCGFAAVGESHLWLWAGACLFFSCFNLLEATLPSLVSRLAPDHMRGAALGAYATCQFLGAFVGGMLGGIGLGHLGTTDVFLVSAALALPWAGLLLWGRHKVAPVVTADSQPA